MLLTLHEFLCWTGLTVFELWMHTVAIFISTIILVVKISAVWAVSYWVVFTPLFIASILDLYFLFIVFVRSIIEYKDCKGPAWRFIANLIRVGLTVVFEGLLCYKVEGELEQGQVAVNTSYNIVFLPVWGLSALLIIQICKLF